MLVNSASYTKIVYTHMNRQLQQYFHQDLQFQECLDT